MGRMEYREITPGDREWPKALNRLVGHVPVPDRLWVRGHRLDEMHDKMAVVGARASTAYGDEMAQRIALGLAAQDCTIVSGAAYGIDSAAHRATLSIGGLTVAVLAGGVDVPYPRAHDQLISRIAEEGSIVSAYPPGSPPTRTRFLERNWLVAALSEAVVVVEAGERSGALSTANRARKLDVPVFAVPGPVTSTTSVGTHNLIRSGTATLVTSAGDVLEEMKRRAR